MLSFFLACVVVGFWIFAIIIASIFLLYSGWFFMESAKNANPRNIALSLLLIFAAIVCELFVCLLPKYLEEKEKVKENIPRGIIESHSQVR